MDEKSIEYQYNIKLFSKLFSFTEDKLASQPPAVMKNASELEWLSLEHLLMMLKKFWKIYSSTWMENLKIGWSLLN